MAKGSWSSERMPCDGLRKRADTAVELDNDRRRTGRRGSQWRINVPGEGDNYSSSTVEWKSMAPGSAQWRKDESRAAGAGMLPACKTSESMGNGAYLVLCNESNYGGKEDNKVWTESHFYWTNESRAGGSKGEARKLTQGDESTPGVERFEAEGKYSTIERELNKDGQVVENGAGSGKDRQSGRKCREEAALINVPKGLGVGVLEGIKGVVEQTIKSRVNVERLEMKHNNDIFNEVSTGGLEEFFLGGDGIIHYVWEGVWPDRMGWSADMGASGGQFDARVVSYAQMRCRVQVEGWSGIPVSFEHFSNKYVCKFEGGVRKISWELVYSNKSNVEKEPRFNKFGIASNCLLFSGFSERQPLTILTACILMLLHSSYPLPLARREFSRVLENKTIAQYTNIGEYIPVRSPSYSLPE